MINLLSTNIYNGEDVGTNFKKITFELRDFSATKTLLQNTTDFQ